MPHSPLSFLPLKASYNIGACIPLQVDVQPSPNKGSITTVRYYDGSSLIASTRAPYHFAWTTARRGRHTIRAVAVDEHGSETSVETQVLINDPTSPIDLANEVDRYNFTFDTLGVNARDSMPLGNGDLSLNVWTYPNGDVGLLIGKLDAFAQTGDGEGPNSCFSLRKIGQVRISLEPSIFKQAAGAGTYKQTLVLSEAAIYIGDGENQVKVWVDKNRAVIHTELFATREVVMTVKNDSWRTHEVKGEHHADIVLPDHPNQLIWCYHDPRTTTSYRGESEGDLIQQNLPGAESIPRYTTVTFGALVEGDGLTSVDATTLRSQPVTRSRADINVLRYSQEKKATPDKWLPLIQAQAETNKALEIETAWKAHLDWWHGYWDRSQLLITEGEEAWRITSFYLHQRFLYACQTGTLEETWRIPFNGGIFNVDFQDVELPEAYHPVGVGVYPKDPSLRMTADFRYWGASDRSQNTRHTYNPMLLTGDYDQARAWYQWPAITSQAWKQTTKKYTSLENCFTIAGIASWEATRKEHFIQRGEEWRTRIVPEAVGLERGAAYRYTTDVADEYLPYMIDYYELTKDEFFLANSLVPYAEGLFRFFEQFYPRDDHGKIVLWPCLQSEVYVRFYDDGYVPINPIAGVALMHTQLPRLIALSGLPGVKEEAVELWKRVLNDAPSMPTGVRRNNEQGLLPYADPYDNESTKTQGADRATLYAIWPYRAYMFREAGTSEQDYQLALNTLHLDDNGSEGWHYADYCAAILGLAERAKQGVLSRVNEGRNGQTKVYFRFPPFQYSAEPDYVPNMESGGIVESTLQYMLWNWKGNSIYLCPAWPKDWNCKFKFQAPGNTVVQGHITNGEVILEHVVPESRRRDIVICELQ
ncbi:DUF5703 domain-containing protein [Coraliomargarita algicola]|uniref:DUF5703 domain-containing protein n=1 Tax=Coraliomargarita algicola TaxID=3092156 RepID=A0ABZ0RH96_9BACT|nr:DUF5703 domain-containing protein [Coraliomargarita sp. J2-16]WPJ95417.1 DUF5703 domain-containing protein [Coraliomargarita sp. J2-16]